MRPLLRPVLSLLLVVGLTGLAKSPPPVTIFIAGDSTAADKQPEDRPETGWGEQLQAFFDPSEVRVANHARNGRSTRTFIEEGRWQALLDEVAAGDYVLIQFGHNDQSESKPDRYTPPDQFRANLVRFVEDVRAKDATPVLMTPVVRRRFDEQGRFYDVHGVYPDLTRSVAEMYDVPLLDAHRRSEAVLREAGEEGSKALFLLLDPGEYPNYPEGLDDNTHFSPRGADVMAGLVAEAMQARGLELASFLQSEPDRAAPYDAIVDAAHAGAPGAVTDGTPTYATVGEALAAVPEENAAPFRVFIRDGRYVEKLSVDRPHVHLVGESQTGTVLTYDAAGSTPNPEGGTYGTWGSFTLRVTAPDFTLENLTVENSFDYPANAAKADDDPTKLGSPQAVALMTDVGSDRAVFRNCTVRGYQDTLFLESGRAYFEQCRILGHVDFIFGAGQVVFDDCDIVSRNRVDKNPTGYVTAPSTPISRPYGFLFVGSRFLKESPDVPAESVRLGRPWHPGADPRAVGSAVFIDSFMDDHMDVDGYAPISAGTNEAGERVWFDLEPTSRFFEYGTYGPGAHEGPRRPTLTAEEAQWYAPEYVLAGWEPAASR
jgi:pectinesterase